MNEIKAPENISKNILQEVHSRLNPPYHIILLKLFSVHLAVGAITLGLCPQLGLSTFKSSFNLMNYFMYFGSFYCDIFCGLFFTFASMLVTFFVLSHNEKRVIRAKRILSSLSLILFSIGFFIIFNPNLFVQLSILWIFGAFMGAMISLELGQFLLIGLKKI